jgi:hypothetical protein
MRSIVFTLCVLGLSTATLAQAPIPELSSAQKAEALKLFQEVRTAPRGPYGPIRWYCDDGRVLPPAGTPCGEGKGHQHAAPSDASLKLAGQNFDIARFLAGMPFEQYFDEQRNHFWLRQMVLFEFLNGATDGWIYRKTYSRRGVRQVEDEERAGRRLLAQLLENHEWVRRNYLLAMLAGAATPHGAQTSNLRKIRSLSAALAAANSRFQSIRGKIHSKPEAEDVELVARFIREQKPENADRYADLLKLMQEEYKQKPEPAGWSFSSGAARSLEIRKLLTAPGLNGLQRLALLDEQMHLQDLAFRAGTELPAGKTRRQLLEEASQWLRYAAGGGYISLRQLDALLNELDGMAGRAEVAPEVYDASVLYLGGSLEGMTAAVYREVGEVTEHYQTVEPLSAGLIDDILRRSVGLPMSNRAEKLVRDADSAAGRLHRVLSGQSARGIRALNPGIAVAGLDIVDNLDHDTDISPDRIYVIPATAANLKPVKGILTLDSGNALSHTQLLAANLGIPNATVPSTLLPELQKIKGREVFYAVTPGGTVVLLPWETLSAAEQANWRKTATGRRKVTLNTARLDLSDRTVKSLLETSSQDSGVRSGPKAANLGQLMSYFPDRVSPGLVIPFGVYYAHVTRPAPGGLSIQDQVRVCYEEAERMRANGASAAELLAFARPRLAGFRKAVRAMPLEDWLVDELTSKMSATFGPDGSYGVFVRSDTNAEDLPEFSGAGLNLTVPNVVGVAKILQAVKDVWASPFEERAYEWRAEALVSSVEVYPSVVLSRTVGTTKSGVMATANLRTLRTDEITVNVNEGTAAVVDGGVAESLLLKPDGTIRLLAQARSPYRKYVLPEGGLAELPTSGEDYVLTGGEIEKLRELAREVNERFPKARDAAGAVLPWDIEFGFLNDKLYLFQIRPLVRYREAKILEALAAFEGRRSEARIVKLDEAPEG